MLRCKGIIIKIYFIISRNCLLEQDYHSGTYRYKNIITIDRAHCSVPFLSVGPFCCILYLIDILIPSQSSLGRHA